MDPNRQANTESMRRDSTVVKIDYSRAPRGVEGQKYLACGVRTAMRLWESEPPGDLPESTRDYEVIGYVLAGQAELHLEGQMVTLAAGDSYVVPRGARHHYRIVAPFTAVEATSPPAHVHGRDEKPAQRSAETAPPPTPTSAEDLDVHGSPETALSDEAPE